MDAITELFKQDFSSTILGIFIIMSGIIAVYEIVCRFSSILGKPIGVIKQRKADHELIISTVKELKDLQEQHEESVEQSIRHDDMINNKLNKLTSIIMEKSIEDFRWEILDFSSVLSSGRKYNLEAYNHIFNIYEKYENILRANDMENGLVEESIKFIREKYNEKLKKGDIY